MTGTWRRLLVLVAVAAAVVPVATDLWGQDSAAVAPDSGIRAAAPDTVADSLRLYAKAPISPMGGLWRSLLIPGWGQAKLNRKLTGALFVVWEGVTLGMSIKTSHELSYLRRTRSGSVHSKEEERQDWLVLMGFNHLFSGIEAYVSAHLWDFPQDLEIRAAPMPGGGIGGSIQIPFRVQ